MSDRLHSYPKVWNVGHPNIAEIFSGPVVVQEKVDGSQFSFGAVNGELLLRSKGATLYMETRDKLFRGAMDTAHRLFCDGLLTDGWVYRGEALMSHKHNALAYERPPTGNVILFDIDTGLERRANPVTLETEAHRLGLESVRTHYVGEVSDVEQLRGFLDLPSALGGRTEGIVVKNYARWGRDGKMLMAKLVAADFREINASNWKKDNPTRADIIDSLIERYRSEPRWMKAVQHLREAGELAGEPKDIGKLMRAVPDDIREECEAEIKDALFAAFWKDIARGSTRGLPEWYKASLAQTAFDA